MKCAISSNLVSSFWRENSNGVNLITKRLTFEKNLPLHYSDQNLNIVPIFSFFVQVDFTAKPTYWRPLYPPVKLKLGELLVSLTYLPAKNTLTIGILKAKNLKAKDINGKSGEHFDGSCIFSRKKAWIPQKE